MLNKRKYTKARTSTYNSIFHHSRWWSPILARNTIYRETRFFLFQSHTSQSVPPCNSCTEKSHGISKMQSQLNLPVHQVPGAITHISFHEYSGAGCMFQHFAWDAYDMCSTRLCTPLKMIPQFCVGLMKYLRSANDKLLSPIIQSNELWGLIMIN